MTSAYKSSPKWLKRIEELFHQSDLNKDGFVSIEDFEIWIENIEKETKADTALIEKADTAMREYWESVGLKPGVKLTKEQFSDNLAEAALTERAKHEAGDKDSLFVRYTEAVFDVVDTNRNGFLELNEYEKMMQASNFDAGTAKMAFDAIDVNHNAKLSRKDLLDYNAKFWLYPDDQESAGFYGPKYE